MAASSNLERELREQGSALADRWDQGWEAAERAAGFLRAHDVDHVVVAARGSSDNAARYAQYLFGSRARITVGLAAPWLFEGQDPPLLRGAAVMGISQSGRSPDIVGVLEAAGAQGQPTIAITNEPESPLAAAAEVLVPLHAGLERSVAATKTYLCSLHAIAQIAMSLAPSPDDREWFARLPALVSATMTEQLDGRARFDPLDRLALLTVIGRGLQLSTAFETALKVRELAGMPTEAFSVPDLLHGPIAGLTSRGGVWLVSSRAHQQPDQEILGLLGDRPATVVAVSDRDELLRRADIAVPLDPGLPEWAAPFLAVLPAQAAALRLGELRGVDLDSPHRLDKVTLTR